MEGTKTKTEKGRGELENVIDEIRGGLSWRVEEGVGSRGWFEVVSFPLEKKHVVWWPDRNVLDPPRLIEVAHELLHAKLAEDVHPLFSGSFFVPGTPEGVIKLLVPGVRVATDWFVDERLYRYCPDMECEEIREHLTLMRRFKCRGDVDAMLMWGFLEAQAVRYGVFPEKRCRKRTKKARIARGAMEGCLSVDPANASVAKLRKLTNLLLGVYSDFCVNLRRVNGMEVWEVRRRNERR